MDKKLYSPELRFVSLIFLAFLFASPAFADEVTEAIDEAMEFYQAGDYTQAAGSLDFAAQLIRQKKGGQLEDILPGPLPGWTAETASSKAYGAAMMGGGVAAQRGFSKADGSVTVTIAADSPMIQGMMMMISNPMFATPDSGKLEKVAGNKALVKYTPAERSGNVNIVYANRFLITVEGNRVDKKDLTAYAAAVDYKSLEKLQ